MNNEMKDSGIEWIGEIPTGWQLPKFKNLAILSNGKEVESNDGNIPVYGSGGIFKWTNKPLFEGISLLTGRKGTIDNPIFVEGKFWTVDTMFYTSQIYEQYVYPKYLFYAFKGCCDFNYYKSGSVLPSMTQSQINAIAIPLPVKDEQKIIVSFLDKKINQIDSLISNQEKQIEKLEEYKQAIITKAVTKGLDPNVKMKESGVEWIGEIPEKWQLPKFKNLATLSNGKEIENDGGDIPVYGSGGIFKWTNKPLFEGVSLLTGRKGTIDNPMLVDGKFWTVDTMFYTSQIYEQYIYPKYLFYAFKGCCNFKFYKSGSVLPSMTQSQINAISIPLPSKEEQKNIISFLEKEMPILENIITLKTNKIEELNAYKKSLIYEYVTGKKRVI